ncbi:MAG TPA: neutral zinc metallopeptidase [Propionibacteriaceae bacterium]|nr:neutral zinc metallopeptidase [Propionibacteriaceae bacterium]
MRLRRSINMALTLVCLLATLAPLGAVASELPTRPRYLADVLTQADNPLAETADVARELSRLEADRDFDALYQRMHPDALAVVPRSAVVGWYETFFSDRETDELTVTAIVPESWTWGVTGTTYDDAVTVAFVQPYTVAGVTADVPGEVHLVPFDDDWGWFFGASRSFVDEQIALYGNDGSATPDTLAQGSGEPTAGTPIPREVRFPDPLHADIDRFWEARFLEVGRAYEPPHGVIGFDEPIRTACGRVDPEQEAAFYCVVDETIYYAAEFRTLVEEQIGDFAWVIVVAHEWSHHIQATIGIDVGIAPDRAGDEVSMTVEQQADCLAGAYALDAQETGWLEPGDIDEALTITELAGDPVSTPENELAAQDTGSERTAAWFDGYTNGLADCELDLIPAAEQVVTSAT